ncbi:hypothetical protein MTO96_005208 [Rhipicephalus appendiculatus]
MLGLAADEAMFLQHRKQLATACAQRAGGDDGAASQRRLGTPQETDADVAPDDATLPTRRLRLSAGRVSPRPNASLPCHRTVRAPPAVLWGRAYHRADTQTRGPPAGLGTARRPPRPPVSDGAERNNTRRPPPPPPSSQSGLKAYTLLARLLLESR